MIITQEKFLQALGKIMKKLTTILIVLMLLICNSVYAKQNKQEENKEIQYLNIEWWSEFNDPLLNEYMLKVFKNNHDLKIAQLKIKQGEQIVKQYFANELPQIGLSGNIERVLRSSDQYFGPNMLIPNFSQTNLLFPISASYEFDIWGMNHTKTKSAKKQLEIIKEEERAKYITVTGNFASAYYNLVKCDKLLKIQNNLVAVQKEILELTNKKFEAGKASVSEVIEQKKLLKSLEEELNTLQKERTLVEEEIKVVLADNDIKEIEDISSSKIPDVKFPDSIPSDIIETRPDYIMTQYNLERMGLDVKVAKKNLLPRFIIFGQFGFNAYRLSNLFNSNALLSSVGVAPVLDIFTGGRKMAYLRFKKYEYEEALEFYKKTVLNSYKEVNDALVSAKIYNKNLLSAKERLELENQNLDIATKLYESGRGSLPDMLYAQERELMVEKNIIDSQINTLISVIGLYKSVGGKNLSEISENI